MAPPDTDSFGLGDFLQTGSLVLARIMPLIVFTPIIGGQVVPRTLKTSIGICLSAAMVPVVIQSGGADGGADGLVYPLALLKEVAFGAVLAIAVLVLLEAFAASGEIIDLSRGATFGNTINPLSQQPVSSALSPLFQQSLITILASSGMLAWITFVLAWSFTVCGPYDLGMFAGGQSGSRASTFALATAIDLGVRFFGIAVAIAAPVLVSTLLVELSIAALMRLAPKVQLSGIVLEVKGVIALLIVVGFIGYVLPEFAGAFVRFTESVARAFSDGQG